MEKDTTIDLVLDEVRSKRTVSISALAKKFGVSKELMREWAEALEKQGLVSLHYPLLGSLKLKAIIKGTKPAKKDEKVASEVHKRPTSPKKIAALMLLMVIVLFVANYFGILNLPQNNVSESIETLPAESQGGNAAGTPVVIKNVFNKDKDSVTYNAKAVYGGNSTGEYYIYIDKGRIRVDYLTQGGFLLYDGEGYYSVDNIGTQSDLDKKTFDQETEDIMPWTYINLVKERRVGGVRSSVNGQDCIEFRLGSGETVCMTETSGIPVRYTSKDVTISFNNITLAPDISETLFTINNQNG